MDVPYEAQSAAAARRALHADLRAAKVNGTVLDDAALLLSELVGNAVRHAAPLPGGVLRVAWEVAQDAVRLSVTDGGGEQRPLVRTPGTESESGRGLAVVDALAASWGVEPAEPGQRVWAVLSRG